LRPGDPLVSIKNILHYVFAQQNKLLDAWWHWVVVNKEDFVQLLQKTPFITKERFITFINELAYKSRNPPVKAIAAVKEWLHLHSILPGEEEYSYDELALFHELKQAYTEQRPVICSSKEEPPQGITMRHTYALIGIKESKLSHRKFVILRNPHHENRYWLLHYLCYGGRHATEYLGEGGKAELIISPVSQSTFSMELRDFAHAFAYIDCGRSLQDEKLFNQPPIFG
jgi:hypothetical protein